MDQFGTGPRRAFFVAFDERLDDGAHRVHLGEEGVPRHAGGFERQMWQPFADPWRQGVAFRRVIEGEGGVALAGQSLVELDDGASQSRAAGFQRHQSVDEAGFVRQVLDTVRDRHAGFAHELPAAAFRTQPLQRRVTAVDRQPQAHGERAFRHRYGIGGDVGVGWITDGLAQPIEQTGPRQDLVAQRPGTAVVAGEHGQPSAGMLGWHAL